MTSDLRPFQKWLDETPREEQIAIAREFDLLVEAQRIIQAQILALPVEQLFSDSETVLPLLDQWTAINDQLRANQIANIKGEMRDFFRNEDLKIRSSMDSIRLHLTQQPTLLPPKGAHA